MSDVAAAARDEDLLARLRTGDEDAYMELVDRYGPVMLRIALSHVSSHAVAEEVVQEAWLGVLEALGRFEGRSSLKTWILRIVANQARTRGERARRSVPASALALDEGEPAVDPARFRWDAEEVSDALGLSVGNQRVLLHRARSKVRNQLEGYSALLQRAASMLAESGIEPALVAADTEPAQALIQTARAENADLIVVGATGSGYVRRALVGSTAENVVRHAPCDVLIVR